MKRERTVRPASRQPDSSQLEGVSEPVAPITPLFQHSLEQIAVHTPSQRLEAGLRSQMEHSFGASFADVRVAELPSVGALGARALTHGSNLYFQSGAFQPDSVAGRELIGHELAHVVQQRGGSSGRGLSFDSSLESEADGAGAAAARGMAVNVGAGSASGLGVQAKFGDGLLGKVKHFFGFGASDSEAPELAAAPHEPKFETTPLKPEYRNEQIAFPGGDKSINERTKYFSAEERADHALSFDGGLASIGGQQMDTSQALGSGNNKSKAGRNIFTMDAEGQFHGADAMSEWLKVFGDGQRIHHSSLADGQAVAGAGELEVIDGRVKTISDQSGHYKPDAEKTLQVVQQLESHGALRDTRPDESGHAVNRPARVELQGKNYGEGEISLSSEQFLQTGGNESQIRNKLDLNSQIGGLQSTDESENTPSQVLARAKAQKQAEQEVAKREEILRTYQLSPAEKTYNRTPDAPSDYEFAPSDPSRDYEFAPAMPEVDYGRTPDDIPASSNPYNVRIPVPDAISDYSRTPAEYQRTPASIDNPNPYQMTPADVPAPYQRTPSSIDNPYRRTPKDVY